MVSVEVLDKLHDFAPKSVDDGLDLLGGGEIFNHFLQSAGSMLVQGNINQARGSRVDKDSTLLMIRILKKFLAEIVAKGVCFQLEKDI